MSYFPKFGDWGSSPLARGTQFLLFACALILGLIPARAGNTSFLARGCFGVWAHPRSRGEHFAGVARRTLDQGSSPLARGTHPDSKFHLIGRGLIPARAGNTSGSSESPAVSRAHPRSRGEHNDLNNLEGVRKGSSPLARGTLRALGRREDHRGLIPARAGNTAAEPRHLKPRWAHPRSRGEHVTVGNEKVYRLGSSPLARGTLPH